MLTYQGKVRAPEFPDSAEWINTSQPPRIRDLRGKVVLLDFWTYCCINCMHVIPELKRLERKYPNELVVIGVHSAKFAAERETGNIRQAVLRYEIEHPVVNDGEMRLWREYGVNAWPTLVLVDPAGQVVAYWSGEGVFDAFDTAIAALIREFDARGAINREPLQVRPDRRHVPTGPLAFPGKVLADEKSGLLFIADSNHNRIVVASLADGSLVDVIGTGTTGMDDGSFGAATVNHPQGMAADGDILYIADTENHAIRVADLAAHMVITIAGTGRQARQPNRYGPARATDLNSPWDLVLRGGSLFVAMAGAHQIWRLDLDTAIIRPHAGTGREARTDGSLGAAAFAQPSGIATDGTKLYVADSETSSIRSVDIDRHGHVETIVGVDLFDFGDRDGCGLEVRLQHPLGVAWHEGVLYVADTYNNKIKRISTDGRCCETLLGTGEAGLRNGQDAAFDEPGGLSVARGRLYIADTDNHAIRVADPGTRAVHTMHIRGLVEPPTHAAAEPTVERIILPPQRMKPGQGNLTITLELPADCEPNPNAPSVVSLGTSNFDVLSFDSDAEVVFRKPQFPLELSLKANSGRAAILLDYVLYYCKTGKDESVCLNKEENLELPVEIADDAAGTGIGIVIRV